jgi:hypothetical protein
VSVTHFVLLSTYQWNDFKNEWQQLKPHGMVYVLVPLCYELPHKFVAL